MKSAFHMCWYSNFKLRSVSARGAKSQRYSYINTEPQIRTKFCVKSPPQKKLKNWYGCETWTLKFPITHPSNARIPCYIHLTFFIDIHILKTIKFQLQNCYAKCATIMWNISALNYIKMYFYGKDCGPCS